jgi:hypothetical protein
MLSENDLTERGSEVANKNDQEAQLETGAGLLQR